MSAINLSKLSTKYQITIPEEIRKILQLNKTDSIIFEVQKNQTVVIRKAVDFDHDWASENDDIAYKDL